MQYKPFLWLHIKKAGGESFREAFDPYYIQTDRRKNYKTFIALPKEQWNDVLNNFKIPLGEYDYKRMLFAQKFLYSPQEFEKMFKFVIVRNPYDRAVSCWRYLTQKPISYREVLLNSPRIKAKRSFLYFLQSIEKNRESKIDRHKATHTAPIWSDLTDEKGKVLVDEIYRLENIEKDIISICDHLQIKPINYSHINKSNRQKEYRQYYDQETKALVEKLFADDLHYLNYTF